MSVARTKQQNDRNNDTGGQKDRPGQPSRPRTPRIRRVTEPISSLAVGRPTPRHPSMRCPNRGCTRRFVFRTDLAQHNAVCAHRDRDVTENDDYKRGHRPLSRNADENSRAARRQVPRRTAAHGMDCLPRRPPLSLTRPPGSAPPITTLRTSSHVSRARVSGFSHVEKVPSMSAFQNDMVGARPLRNTFSRRGRPRSSIVRPPEKSHGLSPRPKPAKRATSELGMNDFVRQSRHVQNNAITSVSGTHAFADMAQTTHLKDQAHDVVTSAHGLRITESKSRMAAKGFSMGATVQMESPPGHGLEQKGPTKTANIQTIHTRGYSSSRIQASLLCTTVRDECEREKRFPLPPQASSLSFSNGVQAEELQPGLQGSLSDLKFVLGKTDAIAKTPPHSPPRTPIPPSSDADFLCEPIPIRNWLLALNGLPAEPLQESPTTPTFAGVEYHAPEVLACRSNSRLAFDG